MMPFILTNRPVITIWYFALHSTNIYPYVCIVKYQMLRT
jgi:hypothetical protein